MKPRFSTRDHCASERFLQASPKVPDGIIGCT
jgi:hypothetical protein